MDRLPGWLDGILNMLIGIGEILAKWTPGDLVDKIVKGMKEMRDALKDGGLPGGDDLMTKWLLPGPFAFPALPPAAVPPGGGGLGIPLIPPAP